MKKAIEFQLTTFLILVLFSSVSSQQHISPQNLFNTQDSEITQLLTEINKAKPIILQKKMYRISTKKHCLLFFDKSRNISYTNLKANNFSPDTSLILPTKFHRGQYNNWIFFQVKNPYFDTMKIIVKGYLERDSFWIYDDRSLLQIGNVEYPSKKDLTGNLTVPIQEMIILHIPPLQWRNVLIKNYEDIYKDNGLFPLISDTSSFESIYFYRNSLLIFWFTFAFGVLCCITLFFAIQYIYNKDKVLLWYVIFCLTNGFIIWRYIEETNLHLYSTLYYLEWTYTKLFQAAISIISYSLFIGYFLEFKPRILAQIIKFIVVISFIAIGIEIILLNVDHFWSWLFYYCYRMLLTVVGFITLFIIARSTTLISRLILLGCFFLLSSEILSWFFGGNTASLISLLGVTLELLTFTFALGVRTKMMYDDNTRLKMEKLKHEKEKEVAELNIKSQIASDIHDDMGLSLTSLKFLMLNINRKKEKSLDLTNELNQISTITDELSERITEIVWSMNADKDNLQEFCFDIKRHFYTFLEEYNFEGKITIPEHIENCPITGYVRRNLFLCIKEALNNVVKHSGATCINMLIEIINNELKIHIHDNGKGMQMDKINNDPFKGNGLKNMEKRISSMNGKIETRNQNGFCIVLKISLAPH